MPFLLPLSFASKKASPPLKKDYNLLLGLLLLLSHFSRVRLCETPETAAHQAPPSLGFSRQEHGSGLPFPSPMHESEKGKWSRSVMSDPQRPHGLQPTRLLHPWDFPGKSTAQLNPPFIQTVILKYLLGTTVKTTTNIYRMLHNLRNIFIYISSIKQCEKPPKSFEMFLFFGFLQYAMK